MTSVRWALGKQAEEVQRPRAGTKHPRLPGVQRFEQSPHRSIGRAKQIDFLRRFGQVERQRDLFRRRNFDRPAQQIGMDAVRGVGGQAGSHRRTFARRECQKALSGEFQGGGDPPGRRGDQLGKHDAVDRGLRKRFEGIVRLRDVAQPGRAPADAFLQSPLDRPAIAARILSAKRDDLANPLGQCDSLSSQRRRRRR